MIIGMKKINEMKFKYFNIFILIIKLKNILKIFIYKLYILNIYIIKNEGNTKQINK